VPAHPARLTVAAQVEADDGVAGPRQGFRHVGITAHMLTKAVNQRNGGFRLRVGLPAPELELQAILAVAAVLKCLHYQTPYSYDVSALTRNRSLPRRLPDLVCINGILLAGAPEAEACVEGKRGGVVGLRVDGDAGAAALLHVLNQFGDEGGADAAVLD